ncbi:MAG: LPP20 family lipoprotein [Candidatus Kryptoniota bacterium]
MKKAKLIGYVIAAFLSVILVGCGGSQSLQSAGTGDIPEWYTNVPQDPNFLYAANSQASQDMQMAVDKATAAARADIGRQLELKIQGLQKRFVEETGTGNDAQILQMFTQAEKTVVSTTLNGSRVKNQKSVRDGNLWRAYVLVEYPIGAANSALMQQIKNNNQMYTRFRASQAFKELQDEVDKYEKFKQEQSSGPH